MFILFFRDDDINCIPFLGMMVPFLYHVYTIVSDDGTIFIPCLYHLLR